MNKTAKYTDEPIKAKIIKDFLPKPEDLVLKEEQIKVTLSLSQKSVNFFKSAAKKHGGSYQAMIRSLLDHYVSHQPPQIR
jgi:predicted DNA binding CopG/RHH family protein